MDWYSWLSRTNLEPALTYEYGLSFTRNELQREDLSYFNHEFLLSLGINIAKHRLEILKLVRKELGGGGATINGLSKLVLAFNRTKKLFTRKNTGKLSSPHKNSPPPVPLDMSAYRSQWSGALKRLSSSNPKEQKEQEKTITTTPRKKNVMRSGPLDRRALQLQDRTTAMTNKCLSVSGPLDGTSIQEKWMAVNWSPIRAVPIDGKWRSEKSSYGYGSRSPSNYNSPWEGRTSPSPMPHHHCYHQPNVGVDEGAQSLWALMFQDLKPT